MKLRVQFHDQILPHTVDYDKVDFNQLKAHRANIWVWQPLRKHWRLVVTWQDPTRLAYEEQVKRLIEDRAFLETLSRSAL